MDGLTQYGFTMGDGVLAVERLCSSRPGERRRWACIRLIVEGRHRVDIQVSARRVWVNNQRVNLRKK